MIRGEDGQKMSKSRGNVVNPDIVVKEYGADSFRLYEMFMGPLEKSKPWNTKGLQGCSRFISKVWRLCTQDIEKITESDTSKETQKLLHQTIKKVTDDLNNLRFNTVVSHLMIFTNHLQTLDSIDKSIIRTFLLLLNPLAPHISEEINEMLGYSRIASSEWPTYNINLIEEEKITIAVQFNGKTRGTLSIDSDSNEGEILNSVNINQKLSKYFVGFTVIKTILIPKRLINFVLKPE
jgi:leucyl-tRNA synthetase